MVSIIIPCYCSEKMLPDVTARIACSMAESYELILVNDSSPDGTFGVITELAKKDPHIIGIDLARNFGQHSAIFAGFHYAAGDEIVCLDDDGQTPPEAIPALLEAVRAGADVAYAKYANKKHSRFRNFGSRVNDWMADQLLGKPGELYLSSFFAMRRYVMEEILKYENPFVYLPGLILRTTKHICNVDVEHHERETGTSGYTFGKLIKLWLNGFTAFSVKPLRLADILGCVVAGIGFLYLLYTLVMYAIRPNSVVGWHSLMAVLLILGGSIMLMLGVMGEYVGRVYISLNRSPQFVTRNVIRKRNAEGDSNENY